MKALITFQYTEEEFDILRKLGYEIIFKKESEIEFSSEIEDIDTLLCFDPFNRINIEKFRNLKWIQLTSIGINHVPKDIVIKKNITLTNNRGCYSIPIAEWNVLKILEMLKNSKEFYNRQNTKTWHIDDSIRDLYKKTIGFVGTGSIASETAKRLTAFDVEILGLNTSGKNAAYFNKCYSSNDINSFVSKCDVIVVSTPYTEKTHHLLNKNVFEKMKDGVYIINIARGAIIDEQLLIENLKSGKVTKAALDVFVEEPLPEKSPLWEMENVYISSHNSWIAEMNNEKKFKIAYDNMKRYISGEELLNIVDIKRGY